MGLILCRKISQVTFREDKRMKKNVDVLVATVWSLCLSSTMVLLAFVGSGVVFWNVRKHNRTMRAVAASFRFPRKIRKPKRTYSQSHFARYGNARMHEK
jgi:hypothetical protein